MDRTTRVQGAIVRDGSVLLIQHREHATGRAYWLLPGGSPVEGETDEAALRREIREETHLSVRIEHLLFEDRPTTDAVYTRFRTFLCHPEAGEALPGSEPEAEVASLYAITAVRWLDLERDGAWDSAVRDDPWTYPLLKRLQAALGYGTEDRSNPAAPSR